MESFGRCFITFSIRSPWKPRTSALIRPSTRFADAVAQQYRPGDLIWVHDYHLMLLPALLRERLPDARIGFFLHIPFPSSEVFRIIPWRTQILEGLLGADLIGFHTLKPFAPLPHLAMPDQALCDLLARLAERPGTRVHILSGRRRDDLHRWFGHLPIGLYAEHGLWLRPAGGAWNLLTDAINDWKGKVHAIMKEFVARVPGSLTEEKTAGLVWHYRDAESEFALHVARELRMDLMAVLSNVPVEVLQGDKIIEVRLQGVNKGVVVAKLLAEYPGGTIVAMGDDRTDEDMFAALPPLQLFDPRGVATHAGTLHAAGRTRRSRVAPPAALTSRFPLQRAKHP